MQRRGFFCILSSAISFGDNYLAKIEDFLERGPPDAHRIGARRCETRTTRLRGYFPIPTPPVSTLTAPRYFPLRCPPLSRSRRSEPPRPSPSRRADCQFPAQKRHRFGPKVALLAAGYPTSLARPSLDWVLRIGIALCLLIDIGGRAADLEAHYTDAGLFPRDAAIETADAWHISLHFANGQYVFQAILFATATFPQSVFWSVCTRGLPLSPAGSSSFRCKTATSSFSTAPTFSYG